MKSYLAAVALAALTLAALTLAALALAAPAQAAPAQAAGYSVVYAFGDSLSDTGNAWIGSGRKNPLSPPYAAGRFSNGPVWVEDVALALGLAAPAARGLRGTNFAVGGATTGALPKAGGKISAADLPVQINNFAKSVANAAPSAALYTLSIGANDVKAAVNASPNPAQQSKSALAAADAAVEAVRKLVGLGARHVLVANVPDLGLVPDAARLSPQVRAAMSTVAHGYNVRLASGLVPLAASTGAVISLVDVEATLDGVIAAPQRLGFVNVTQGCLSGSEAPVPCASTRAGQDTYLFWDGGHPTAHGHAVIAAQALTQLP